MKTNKKKFKYKLKNELNEKDLIIEITKIIKVMKITKITKIMKIKKLNEELFATKTNLKMENSKQKFLFFRSIQPQYLLQGQNWHLQKNYKKWEKNVK